MTLRTKIDKPKLSKEWKCFLFGSDENGLVYTPREGYKPNFIVRYFCRVLLDCKWVKEKGKGE